MVVRRTLPHRELRHHRRVVLPRRLRAARRDRHRGHAGAAAPAHRAADRDLAARRRGAPPGQPRQRRRSSAPAQLNLMTAGRGISHAETSPAGATGRAARAAAVGRAAVARPRHAPGFDAPRRPAARRSRTARPSPCCSAPLAGARRRPRRTRRSSAPRSRWSPARAARCRWSRTSSTRCSRSTTALAVDGEPLDRGVARSTWLAGRDAARSAPARRAARLFLLGGEPFDEELLMWWNFVARSHDEVVEAREEWTAAVGGADTRFGRGDGVRRAVAARTRAARPAGCVPAPEPRDHERSCTHVRARTFMITGFVGAGRGNL